MAAITFTIVINVPGKTAADFPNAAQSIASVLAARIADAAAVAPAVTITSATAA